MKNVISEYNKIIAIIVSLILAVTSLPSHSLGSSFLATPSMNEVFTRDADDIIGSRFVFPKTKRKFTKRSKIPWKLVALLTLAFPFMSNMILLKAQDTIPVEKPVPVVNVRNEAKMQGIEKIVRKLTQEQSSLKAGLVKALEITDDIEVSFLISQILDNLNWVPANNEEKVYYLIAKERFDELVEMGSSAVPYLIGRRPYESSVTRVRIIETLNSIGDERAFATYMNALNDNSPYVVYAAKESLKKIGVERLTQMLEEAKAQGDMKKIEIIQKTIESVEEILLWEHIKKSWFYYFLGVVVIAFFAVISGSFVGKKVTERKFKKMHLSSIIILIFSFFGIPLAKGNNRMVPDELVPPSLTISKETHHNFPVAQRSLQSAL